MWRYDYGRERYMCFMFNFNLFIIVPWKLTANVFYICLSQARPTLKVASHDLKMKDFLKILMFEQVSRIVRDFELLDFPHCSLTMLDAPLLTAFVERWHKETSSFHLLFGDMTITLDDVSSVFHLPIGGIFWTAPVLTC